MGYDSGASTAWTYDSAGAQPWQRLVDAYDAAGRLVTRDIVFDDGARKAAVLDVDGSKPWTMTVDVFDVLGRQVGHWTYNDDGTFIG